MLSESERAVHPRHDVQPVEPLEHLLLAAQPGYRVRAIHVQASVRPGLLEHDLRAGLNVLADVKAAPVGEVQRPLDPVGQAVHLHTVPRCQMRLEEHWQAHPFGKPECRGPAVGHQSSLRILNCQFQRAGLR